MQRKRKEKEGELQKAITLQKHRASKGRKCSALTKKGTLNLPMRVSVYESLIISNVFSSYFGTLYI